MFFMTLLFKIRGNEVTNNLSQPINKTLAPITILLLIVILVVLSYMGSRLGVIEEYLQQNTDISDPALNTHAVYVPAYSHVYSNFGLPHSLEVTLSVRNTDSVESFKLTRADYYDTKGKLLRRYIRKPKQVGPLVSETFIVEKADFAGGSGANFIVEWTADKHTNAPLVESVMIGIDPEYQVSFIGSSIPVEP